MANGADQAIQSLNETEFMVRDDTTHENLPHIIG
jgi:hypothetical protein